MVEDNDTPDNGGTTRSSTEVENSDPATEDDPRELLQALHHFDSQFEDARNRMVTMLQEAKKVTPDEVPLPTSPLQVPLEEFGGEQWVGALRDEYGIGDLTVHLLRESVRAKSKAEAMRMKCEALAQRLQALDQQKVEAAMRSLQNEGGHPPQEGMEQAPLPDGGHEESELRGFE